MSDEIHKKQEDNIPVGYIRNKNGKIVKKPPGRVKKVHKVLSDKEILLADLKEIWHDKEANVTARTSAASLYSELLGLKQKTPENTNEIAKNCITFKRSEPPKSYKNPSENPSFVPSNNTANKMLDKSNVITKAESNEIPNEIANNLINEVPLINSTIMTATNTSSNVNSSVIKESNDANDLTSDSLFD